MIVETPGRIQLRGQTAAAWTSANPVLGARELALETDTGKLKVGDGSTAWTSRGYVGGSTAYGTLAARPASTGSLSSYFATDDAGGTVSVDTGSGWLPAGRRGELAEVSMGSSFTSTVTGTFTNITSLQLTFATGNRPVYLDLVPYGVAHSVSGTQVGLAIYDVTAAAYVTGGGFVTALPSSAYTAIPMQRAIIPANRASHVYQAQFYTGAAGTFTAAASSATPWVMTAVEQ